jgi:hypothetical protein
MVSWTTDFLSGTVIEHCQREPGSFFANGSYRGRQAGESQYPQERRRTISITNEWLQHCRGNHDRCRDSQQKGMPTRVVYIGTASCIRLVETHQGQHDPYVALSYVWGDGGTPSLSLKREPGRTLLDLQKEIKWLELTLTHQQAIQVARELGYNYIWIDALCVIQEDNGSDWEIEAPLLPKTYGNADLTIMAGRSDDYRKGFLNPTFIPVVQPAQISVSSPSNQVADQCWFSFPRARTIGIAGTRGWCFQEALMSRRMIIYGEQQLSFRCRENHYFEDGHVDPIENDFWYDLSIRNRGGYTNRNIGVTAKIRAQPGYKPTDTTPIRSVTARNMSDVLHRWYSLTEEFSARHFFDPADNHAALSGTVLLFQEAVSLIFASSRYMAGLWENDMVKGLLWEIDSDSPSTLPVRKEKNGMQTVISRAPSWSWMSLVGHIYQAPVGASVGQLCCSPANPDGKTWSPDPDGWGPLMFMYKDFPSIFRLEVKAYIRKVRISQARLPSQDKPPNLITLDSTPPNLSIGSYRHFPESKPQINRGQQTANQLQRFLEADEVAPNSVTSDEGFAAKGLFDLKSTILSPPTAGIHAMRLTSDRGLLLKQIPDPGYKSVAYKRLGTFSIVNKISFYPPESYNREWDFSHLQGFQRGRLFSEDQITESVVVLV